MSQKNTNQPECGTELKLAAGAEARVVYGIDGTAQAMPFHKTIH